MRGGAVVDLFARVVIGFALATEAGYLLLVAARGAPAFLGPVWLLVLFAGMLLVGAAGAVLDRPPALAAGGIVLLVQATGIGFERGFHPGQAVLGLAILAASWRGWRHGPGDRPARWARGLGAVPAALLLAALVLLLLVGAGVLGGKEGPLVGRSVAAPVVEDLAGGTAPAWASRGTFVIEFWSPGCGPCRRLLPALARLARRWQGSGVRFVAVGLGPMEDLLPFARDPRHRGVSFVGSPATEGGDVFAFLGMPGIPQVLVVRDGKVVHQELGAGSLTPVFLDRFLRRQGLRPGTGPAGNGSPRDPAPGSAR